MGLTAKETAAARTLRPYMSKDPVIFDVGSNKGDWASILVEGCKEMHLFEPNEILLHYSMVRFDHLPNVFYNHGGLFSSSGERDFFYFTNSNNGLSSVFKNQIWVDMGLPMKEGKCQVVTLDEYWRGDIDLLKIDVEGADFDVLLGAKNLLTAKAIKFIQVEKSDHLLLSGHTWDELVQYMHSFGYLCFDFNGTEFVPAYFPYESENYYFMQEFTQDWNREFKESTHGMRFGFALEIGAFEGLTTCYMCDNLLEPGGRIIVIDPLPDDHNTLPFGEDNKLFEGQYERFIRNTKGKPVELMRMESRRAFFSQGFSDYRFDFIYIDGDHREDAVFEDGARGFKVLRNHGLMLFDDYGWREETKRGIDRFLRDYDKYLEVVKKGYQVMIKKLANAE